MVIKKVNLRGTSTDSFDDAADNAIDRATETLENLKWADVTEQGVQLAGDQREYQVELEVAFELESPE